MTEEENTSKTDLYLVEKIRNDHDEPALKELISRHSGIYMSMIRKFGAKCLSSTQINDMVDDKDYQIYNAALEYNWEKSKFSTFLALKTKYICLSSRTSNKKRSKFVNFDDVEFHYNGDTPCLESCNIVDPHQDPSQKVLNGEFFQKIYSLIENHKNENVRFILKERYLNSDNGKIITWKEIARKTGLSIQGCINIHNRTIKEFQKKINNEPITF